MKTRSAEQSDRSVLRNAVIAACLIHIVVIILILAFPKPAMDSAYKPLAVMDLADFDPDGGTPGGGDAEEFLEDSLPEEAMAPLAEEEPEPVIEEKVPQEDIKDQVISSSSDKADELVENTKPEEKPVIPEPKPVKKKEKVPAKSKEVKKTASKDRVQGKDRGAEGENRGGGDGSGRGGSGGGTGIGTSNVSKAYLAGIQKKINRYKKYPPSAQAKRLQGIVTVRFSIDRNGNVISSQLVKSSGHNILDEEVMSLLKRVSPFPPVPNEITESPLRLTVPIAFNIR